MPNEIQATWRDAAATLGTPGPEWPKSIVHPGVPEARRSPEQVAAVAEYRRAATAAETARKAAIASVMQDRDALYAHTRSITHPTDTERNALAWLSDADPGRDWRPEADKTEFALMANGDQFTLAELKPMVKEDQRDLKDTLIEKESTRARIKDLEAMTEKARDGSNVKDADGDEWAPEDITKHLADARQSLAGHGEEIARAREGLRETQAARDALAAGRKWPSDAELAARDAAQRAAEVRNSPTSNDQRGTVMPDAMPTSDPDASRDVRKAVQQEAVTTIAGWIGTLRSELGGTSDDSHATRTELRDSITDLSRAANAISKPRDGTINLSRRVVGYGYDPEVDLADRSSGIEPVDDATKARQRHEMVIARLEPVIAKLSEAGFRVDTEVRSADPSPDTEPTRIPRPAVAVSEAEPGAGQPSAPSSPAAVNGTATTVGVPPGEAASPEAPVVRTRKSRAKATTPAPEAPAQPEPKAAGTGVPADPKAVAASAEPVPSVERPTPATTIGELAQQLSAATPALAERDAMLAEGVQKLAAKSADAGTVGQPQHRTLVAYALQDMEKSLGANRFELSPELRAEMTAFAATAPGLQNKQMEALVGRTAEIGDAGLVRDVRRAATIIGGMAEQDSPGIRSNVDALEKRVREAPPAPASRPDDPRPAASPAPAADAATTGTAPLPQPKGDPATPPKAGPSAEATGGPPAGKPNAAAPPDAGAGSAKPNGADATATNAKPDDPKAETEAPGPGTNGAQPQPARDPIVDLVLRMQDAYRGLGEPVAGLSAGLARLATQSAEPERVGQAYYRTQVAYALQDVERTLAAGGGNPIEMAPDLRAEMTTLAATAPGLTNKRMEALVRSTPDIDDTNLVRDVRRAALVLGEQPDQHSAPINEKVDVLENRVRMATKPARPVQQPDDGPLASPAAQQTRAATSPGGGSDDPAPRPQNIQADQAVEQVPPGGTQQQAPVAVVQQQQKPQSLAGQITGWMRSPSTSPPWAPPPVAMGDRITNMQRALDQGRTDQLIRATETSGVSYMQAIETFASGPGAGILGKIDNAASTEPGGIQSVMREMQPGGRYANLRTEFDGALQQDRVFAAAYNQVEQTGAAWGQNRTALAADFEAKQLGANQLDARFARAEEAIGEATEKMPGRTPGKTVMEELGEKVAEILKRAAERVRSAFGVRNTPQASPSPSPSP